MVSPVHGDYRRCQAEIPLIVLCRFPGPALPADPQVSRYGLGFVEKSHNQVEFHSGGMIVISEFFGEQTRRRK
jgi:hypothetical protein